MLTITVGAGLGNQLFMIAAGFGFKAINPSAKLMFEDRERGGDRPSYWNTFFADCPEIQETRVHSLPEGRWEKHGDTDTAFVFFNYNGLIRRNVRQDISTHITGYFQNLRYLPDKSSLTTIFRIPEKQDKMRLRFPEINFEETCSIHFRLGDYKYNQGRFPLLPNEYYRRALEEIKKLHPQINRILVFNESTDSDDVRQRLTIILTGLNYGVEYITSRKLADWEELILMSICHSNIIANSTFSWWGAYLNFHSGGTVICPRTWINVPDSGHWNLSLPDWKLI